MLPPPPHAAEVNPHITEVVVKASPQPVQYVFVNEGVCNERLYRAILSGSYKPGDIKQYL